METGEVSVNKTFLDETMTQKICLEILNRDAHVRQTCLRNIMFLGFPQYHSVILFWKDSSEERKHLSS